MKRSRKRTKPDPKLQAIEDCFWDQFRPVERKPELDVPAYDIETIVALFGPDPCPRERYRFWAYVTRWLAVESTNAKRPVAEQEMLWAEFTRARNAWLEARKYLPREWDGN